MKRFASLILALVMIISLLSCITVNSANEIFYDGQYHTYTGSFMTLKLNGEELKCEVPPIIFNDYSVVPARDVFEKLGAAVLWNASNEKVTVNFENTKIELYINNVTAYKNGKSEKMPIAPKIINGKTMIPARYVSESLGFDVDFDSKTDTISIVSEKEEKPVYTHRMMSYTCTEKDGLFSASFTLSKENVKHSYFALTSPERLAVDISSTDRAPTIKDTEITSEIVTKVRIGQHNDGVRIVFDLPSKQDYKVTLSGKVLTVLIGKGAKDTEVKPTPTPTPDTQKPTTEKPDDSVKTEEPDEKEFTPPPEALIDIAPSRSITIDAGHGGEDPGAIYTDETGKIWKESEINLAVSLKVRDILKQNGVRVVMTRETDKTVVRKDRPILANTEKTALFISIHTNSVEGNTVANGFETWGSLELLKDVGGVTDKSFAENVQDAVIDSTDAKDRGVKDSVDLTVLYYSAMPSILVEVGFITNDTEREKMFSESYRDKLAQGIANGILKTFEDMGV